MCFVRFLEELRIPNNVFEIYWPLPKHCKQICWPIAQWTPTHYSGQFWSSQERKDYFSSLQGVQQPIISPEVVVGIQKLYIPSTLNIILLHTQKNVKSWFKSWIISFTFQAYTLPHTLNDKLNGLQCTSFKVMTQLREF